MSRGFILSSFLLGLLLFNGSTIAAATTVGGNVSSNWAGYTATSDQYTGVGATWTITAPKEEEGFAADAVWVGVGGVESRDLIQAGIQSTVEDGEVSYYAWYETLPRAQKPVDLRVRGGDSVSVSIEETSKSIWHIKITNNTTGKSYEKDIQYSSKYSSADWIVERPLGIRGRFARYMPLDDFGIVNFTNSYAIVNGVRTNLREAGAKPVNMVTNQVVLATPTVIGPSGASFSLTRTDENLPTRYAIREISTRPEPEVIVIHFRYPHSIFNFPL